MTRSSQKTNRPGSAGFTLIELLVAIAIVAIPIMAIGILLSGANRGWEAIYDDTNSPIQADAAAVMASLQSFGRWANIANYQIYTAKNNNFTPAVPLTGQSVASGTAVEFRYWADKFNPANNGADVLDTNNTGTHYAFYYLTNNQLKVDFGRVVNNIGAVRNGTRQTSNLLTTQVLANDVNTTQSNRIFSHTLNGGTGTGCINTNLTLTNNNGVSIEIKCATLLRAAWPQ